MLSTYNRKRKQTNIVHLLNERILTGQVSPELSTRFQELERIVDGIYNEEHNLLNRITHRVPEQGTAHREAKRARSRLPRG